MRFDDCSEPHMKFLPLILLPVVLVVACTSAPELTPPSTPEVVTAPATHLGAWYWTGTVSTDNVLIAADPARYRIEFTDATTMAVQADCNRGRASYTLSSQDELQTGPIGLTKMGCPEDSQDRQFLTALAAARRLQPGADWLRAELADGQGSMLLARDSSARLHQYRCADSASFAVGLAPGGALVLVGGKSWFLPQMPANSGFHYRAGQLDLQITGAVAQLTGADAPRGDCHEG
jgi:heat shock protein HslJ